MASPALTHSSHGHFVEVYSGPLTAIPTHEAEQANAHKAKDIQASQVEPLGAAKGALIAVGLEAAIALMAMCVYEIFRHAIFLH